MRGVSQTLWIIVAAIVVIVVALVIIQLFGGGIANFLNIFNPWAQNTGDLALCQSKCSTLCVGQPLGTTNPPGWSSSTASEGKPCTEVMSTCSCSGLGGTET